MHVAKYAAIIMSKNNAFNEQGEKGVIMMVSSIHGKEGGRGYFSYAASKSALSGMVMPMARDLGKFNIRVVAIAPGLFETPMTAGVHDEMAKR